MLLLYHAGASTCSQMVRLCLAEKNLPYEEVLFSLRDGEHLNPEFLKLNPKGLVPVLVYSTENGQQVITEASAINYFLEQNFPEPVLMPSEPDKLKAIKAWNDRIDDTYILAIKIPSYQLNIRPSLLKQDAEKVRQRLAAIPNPSTRQLWTKTYETGFSEAELNEADAQLRGLLDTMQQQLDYQPYLFGKEISLADLHTFPFVERLYFLPDYQQLKQWPKVQQWHAALRKRPSYVAARFVVQ